MMPSKTEQSGKKHPATQFFSNHHPLARHVNFEFLETGRDALLVRTIAPKQFAKHAKSNQLHSGYLTNVLDSLMGGVVFGMLDVAQPIATVNLATNHMRKPAVGETLLTKTKCSGVYEDLAYVEGTVEVEATGELLASAVGTFMIGTRATSIRDVQEKAAI